MPKIIRDRLIVDDEYQLVLDGELPAAPVLVSLPYFLQHRDQVLAHRFAKGVQLQPAEHPEQLTADLPALDLIALHFPAFADGRGYSHAWLLRNRLGFRGELRATGDVFKDNLFYLHRCGCNSFAIRADKDIQVALSGLDDFSESYQASSDQPLPLFRRRLAG